MDTALYTPNSPHDDGGSHESFRAARHKVKACDDAAATPGALKFVEQPDGTWLRRPQRP